MKEKICIFSNKHTVLTTIVVSLLLLGMSSFFTWDDKPVMGWDKLCTDALIIILCLWFIYICGLWNTAGFHFSGLRKGLFYGIPFLIIGIGSVVISNIGVNLNNLQLISTPNAILFTINMLLVGMNEEIWMRAFVLNALIRKYGTDKHGIWKSLILSACIFGAIHIPNIFFMNPITLIVQVVNAAAAGILFGVIFIKCKNIWAGVLVHAMVDWCSLFLDNCFVGADSVLSMNMNIGQAILIIFLGSVPPIIISILYLKKIIRASIP